MKPLFDADASLHGRGPVKFSWQKDGNYLASVGSNGLLQVFDRHGQVVDEVALGEGMKDVASLAWDSEGDCLAVLSSSSNVVQLYELSTRKISPLDTGMKESLTFAAWSEPIGKNSGQRSRMGSVLAIGTAKGNLVMYQKSNRKKIPIKGKHSGAVRCGAWTSDGRLALGGDDRMLTLSTVQGDTIEQTEVKATPLSMSVREGALNGGGGPVAPSYGDAVTITMAMGKTLLLYDPADADNPIELAFPPKYGSIVSFEWISKDSILVGFSSGYAAAVSTNSETLGKEHFVARLFKSSVSKVAVAPSLGRAAVCGESSVRVIDTKTWKEV